MGRYEQPDKTGSWAQINQNIIRPAGWKQIVLDSKFPQQYLTLEIYKYPTIDGSTVCVPMAVEFARQHLKMTDEEANRFVKFSTTDKAYQNIIDLKQPYPPDLLLVTEPSDEEIALAKLKGIELTEKPICYDAFIFITHKENPVDSLTVEQIQKIYTGEISNWKDVGGKDAEIEAFQREPNSGSQTTMEKQVMKNKPMLTTDRVSVLVSMNHLVDSVAEYKNGPASIGYTFKYYIDTLYKNANIKTIKVDGIAPTEDNIRSGAYPFTTCYYGVIRTDDEEHTGGKFLGWILTEEGQACIKQAGYCPIIR